MYKNLIKCKMQKFMCENFKCRAWEFISMETSKNMEYDN